MRYPRRPATRVCGRAGSGGPVRHDLRRRALDDPRGGGVAWGALERHRHRAVTPSLDALERAIPAGRPVRVILDTPATHETAGVRRRLARHPRRAFHGTPISNAWLTVVEGVLAGLTRCHLMHGFRARRQTGGGLPPLCSVADLQTAINRAIAEHIEAETRPFARRADRHSIVAIHSGGVRALEGIRMGEDVVARRAPHGAETIVRLAQRVGDHVLLCLLLGLVGKDRIERGGGLSVAAAVVRLLVGASRGAWAPPITAIFAGSGPSAAVEGASAS